MFLNYMSYDFNRIKWILNRRYYNLLRRLGEQRIADSAPAKELLIDTLTQRIVADGAICHYCRRDLNLYADTNDFKMTLSLDHKVPLSLEGDNSPDNFIICCARCNFAKGDSSYESFKSKVEELKSENRELLEKFLDERFEARTKRRI